MNKLLLVSVGVILLFALGDALSKSVILPAEEKIVSYKDATYYIDGSFITLTNGVAETEVAPSAASKITTKFYDDEAKGDLNKDGTEDAAFLLVQETGGNGTFYHVGAALMVNKGYFQTNTIFLGDRIAPQSTEIVDGRIVVKYLTRKPSEPRSAKPTVAATKYYKVATTTLVEVRK